MQSILDCLTNTIGLSETSCDCWDVSKPVDFATLNASNSGLYLSAPDTFPVKVTNTAADCEQGGVWDILAHARKEGVRQFIDAYSVVAGKKLETNKDGFRDFIGEAYFNNSIAPRFDFQGHYYEPYKIKGGVMVIESVDLALAGISGSTDIDIFVYSSLDMTTPLGSTTATLTSSNTYATAAFATPIQIDLEDIREDLNEKIIVLYELPSGASPLNNEMEEDCGCVGKSRVSQNIFLQWLCEVNGFEAETIAGIPNNLQATSFGRGLRVKATIMCNWMGWLCDVTTNRDRIFQFGGEDYSLSSQLAYTIRYFGLVALMDAIINAPNLKKYSILSDETNYYAKRGHYAKKAKEGVRFLVDKMPHDAVDCLKCRQKGDLGVYTMYSN